MTSGSCSHARWGGEPGNVSIWCAGADEQALDALTEDMVNCDGSIRVRRAAIGDEAALRALRLEALADAPEAFGSTYEREYGRTMEDWRRWLAPGAIFILEHLDRPSGLVAGVRDPHDPAVTHLMAMWVRAELRGSGAAEALVDAVVAWAAAEGAREVRLQVVKANDRARRCYERTRFVATGREAVRERDGAIQIEMARALGPAPTSGSASTAAR